MRDLYIDVRFSFAVSKSSGAFNGGNNYSKRAIKLLINNNDQKYNIIIICNEKLKSNIAEIIGGKNEVKYLSVNTLNDLKTRPDDILFIPLVDDSFKYEKELKIFKLNNPEVLLFCTIHDCRYKVHAYDKYDGLLKQGVKRNSFLLWLGRKIHSVECDYAIKSIVSLSDKIFTDSSYSMSCINNYKKLKYINSFYQGVYYDATTSLNDGLDGLESDFILFVSAGRPEKNFFRALKAFEKYVVLSENSKIKLVATGIKSEQINNIKSQNFIDNDILNNQVMLMGYVSDEKLDQLYSKCRFLLFVSKCEGFGLPILEALLHEKPMVVSRLSSMPEIAGSVGVYVDPMSVESIADGIKILMNNALYQMKQKYVSEKKKIAIEQINLDDKAFLSEFMF